MCNQRILGEGRDGTYEEMQNDFTEMPSVNFKLKPCSLSKYKTQRQLQNELDQVQVQTVPTNQQSRRCQVTLEVCKHEKK